MRPEDLGSMMTKKLMLYACLALAGISTSNGNANSQIIPAVIEQIDDVDQYDPSSPLGQEYGPRLLPTEFNYAAQARFIGEVPREWQTIDVIGEERPIHYYHPRKLCSPAKYGGSTKFNIGVYCVYRSEWGGYEPVRYAESWDSSFNPDRMRRMAVFCILRSRCLRHPLQHYGPSGVALEVKTDESSAPLYDMNPSPFSPDVQEVPIRLLRMDDFFSSRPPLLSIAPEPHFGKMPRTSASVMFVPEPDIYQPPMCKGGLPPWRLPYPFNELRSDGEYASNGTFTSVGTLCKAMWYGGDYRGNAGFVCKKAGGLAYALSPQEYLAHPSFSWTNGNLGLAVLAWCTRACSCLGEQDADEHRREVPLPMYNEGAIARFDDSGIVYLSLVTPFSTTRSNAAVRLIPVEGESCFDLDIPRCPARDWGHSCTAMKDCKSDPSLRELCINKPTISQIQSAGLSPWIPRSGAMCLPAFAAILGAEMIKKAGQPGTSRWRPLIGGGRKRSQDEEEKEAGKGTLEPVECVCSDTVISAACCQWHEDYGEDGILMRDSESVM